MKGSKLIGAWRFVSIEVQTAGNKTVYPYGEKPFGMLIYTPTGHMSVLLMNPDRVRFALDDPLSGTDEEVLEAYRTFDAYCGTYTVDAEKGIVTHHLQGSKFPNWVGSDQVRQFRFSGNNLMIDADMLVQDENWHFRGVLERL